MQIYAPNLATARESSATPKPSTLDYDAFLHLLIAQMKAQDPTKPADTAVYMGQLASFSAVEQSIKTNTKLDALMTQVAFNQADALIGHEITSADGKITGTVKAIEVYSDGTLAVLEDGKKVLLEPGVVIS
jgi:flagellar basal-body rod modification protein FlgD